MRCRKKPGSEKGESEEMIVTIEGLVLKNSVSESLLGTTVSRPKGCKTL